MRQIAVLACVLVCTGCARNDVRWVRAGATAMDFNADKAACEYEAQLATPGSYSGRGMGNAIADGISDGMRIGNLQVLCMQARGWQRQVITAAAVPAEPPETTGLAPGR